MLNPVDARRRWYGSFFLILAGGQLLWGFTFLAPILIRRPTLFIAYWITCFIFTALAFSIALYDMRVIRKRLQSEQKSAFSRAFSDIEDVEQKKS
jgi:hypothetical protein